MRVLTIAQTAAILQMTKPRVYEMVRQGILPPGVVVHFGRQVRINEQRFRAWLDDGGQALPGGWRQQTKKRESVGYYGLKMDSASVLARAQVKGD